jgi:hypothetical protein
VAPQGLIDSPGSARVGFLEDLRRATELARDGAGGLDRVDLLIAGRRVRLLFAGPALVEPLLPALEHAVDRGAGDPDLTIRIWDTASTGAVMAAPAWGTDDYREHGVIDGFFDDELQITYQWITHSLSILEPARGEAVYWVEDPAEFPFFDRAAPLRKLLAGWLASRGLQLTHAAALGDEDGCVLLAGNAGAGKSSAALACLGSPVRHIADDYCVLAPVADAPPTVHSLYSSAKAHPDTIERLGLDPGWAANPDRPDGDKAVLYLHRHAPGRLVPAAPLRAIAVPRISGALETTYEPINGGQALAALAPSTMIQLPGTGPATMAALSGAARAVPCFRLDVGTDPAGVPAALERILGSAS